jgi:hypothetical protein
MTMTKNTQTLAAPHDALIEAEKTVLKYHSHRPDTDPFHPLEIVGFVMAGFVAVVLISVLVGRWYFDDPHKTTAKWLQQPLKLAPR